MVIIFEKIRQKPEGTRFAATLALFVLIAGIISTLWLWDLEGRFPYESVARVGASAASFAQSGAEEFRNVRMKLGEMKQQFFGFVSGEK